MNPPSRLRTFCLFLTLSLSLSYAAPSPARAERVDFQDDDGSTYVIETNDDGSVWVSRWDAEGNLQMWELSGLDSNPNPEDGSGGSPPSIDGLKEYIRKHYHGTLGKGEQLDNPFSLKQSGQGKGLVPRWNPSDVANETDSGGSGNGGPGSNSGSAADWVKGMARKGSPNGSGGGADDDEQGSSADTGNNDRPELGTNGSIRPERINPVPVLSQANLQQRALDLRSKRSMTMGTLSHNRAMQPNNTPHTPITVKTIQKTTPVTVKTVTTTMNPASTFQAPKHLVTNGGQIPSATQAAPTPAGRFTSTTVQLKAPEKAVTARPTTLR